MVDFETIDLSCCEEVNSETVCRAHLWSIYYPCIQFLTMDIRTYIIPAAALTVRTKDSPGQIAFCLHLCTSVHPFLNTSKY